MCHARSCKCAGGYAHARKKKNVHIHFLTHIHIHIHTYTLQSRSLLPMSNAFAIVCLVTSIYAIVATSFFAGVQPDHYGSFFISFFSMFQAITGDNWWVFLSIVFAGFRLFASCTPCLPLCDSPLNLRVLNETLLFFKVSDNQKSTGLLLCEQWVCVRCEESFLSIFIRPERVSE